MADSNFNPEALLETNYQEAPSDKYIPIDEGEYHFTIKDVGVREQTTQDGRKFYPADFVMIVDDDEIKAKMNMQEVTARYTVFLDVKPDGTLDFGTNKNVGLGRLMTACGMRRDRQWSIRHLVSQQCYGKIKQEPDRNDPERVYSRVTTVTKEPTQTAPERSRRRAAA